MLALGSDTHLELGLAATDLFDTEPVRILRAERTSTGADVPVAYQLPGRRIELTAYLKW